MIPLKSDSEFINIQGHLDGKDFFISNELHGARGLRKVHLEIAKFGTGLEVLHCVLFPKPTFDIPIFGVDIIAVDTTITAAIVDISPVSNDLPMGIRTQLSNINLPCFRKVRELPEWGNIFSRYVQFIRPDGIDEEANFAQIVDQYLRILVDSIACVEADLPDSGPTIERLKYQQLYCQQQKRNDKTRNVLAKAFDPQWADRYIDAFLFETPSTS